MNTDVNHEHCLGCIKISYCKYHEECAIADCELNCGARFHNCKHEEHKILCPNLKVPCINSLYGCPLTLPRKNKGTHLESCPASVVSCTVEWNRWSSCSKERQSNASSAPLNPQIKEEQLDVALAVRDQGILDHWLSLPKKIKKMTRCSKTPRHPAIPLVSTLWNSTVAQKKVKSSLSEDSFLNASRESTPRQSAERSDTSLLSVTSTDDESPWGRRHKPPGLLQSVCGQLLNAKQQILIDSKPIEKPDKDDNDTLSDISDDLEDGDSAFQVEEVTCKDPISPVPLSMPMLNTLGLELSIECLPRDQDKPKSMYTFVCAQDYRRDEYSWHYNNWHSEIHGGLDGWLEQRCPLARYGCSYARRRLHPAGLDARLIFNDTLQSFGVKYLSKMATSDDNLLLVGELPFEILRTIAKYLDSLSLYNLSLTSKLMRDVARSMVQHRGLVTANWKKTAQGWRLTSKKWRFSSAFSSIKRWEFEGSNHMSNHLQTCPFNIKSVLPAERVALLIFK